MEKQNEYLLKKYFGYDSFRGIQRDIIESICSRRDTVGLMPTGGGKSICFQIPALSMEGVCIVITPLIALMKDQVMHLRRRGIQATAIYSGMTRTETITALENAIFGGVKILYISPERIGSELFQNKLRRIKVSFITVDEAHCISQWGYDFRPSYLHIVDIRKMKPDAPVLALTATATLDVLDDIIDKLQRPSNNSSEGMVAEDFPDRGFRVFRMSFERKNLSYVVRTASDKYSELTKILSAVPGTSIVYVRSREKTKEVAQLLTKDGISATYYHAGLNHELRDARQKEWQDSKVRVIVATNAFGMGIDKPDVRTVIHLDCPDSPEAYFQEAGRAGRDGKKAYAVLLYDTSDGNKLHRRIAENYPEREYIKKVYDNLGSYYQIGVGSGYGHVFAFNIMEFCHCFHHNTILLESALKLLQQAGYIEYNPDPDNAARLKFILERDELYRLNSLTPEEDKVVTALLRNYGGLFVDFVYINEALICKETGLSPVGLYQLLKGLGQRHILTYIPQRKTPYITYLQNREDGERVVIPASIYEDRRQQYVRRIEAMLTYASAKNICRSSFFLNYFGEKLPNDYHCGQCDVCIEQKKTETERLKETAAVEEQILAALADGKEHSLEEFNRLPIPSPLLYEALHALQLEEKIGVDALKVKIVV